MAVDYSRLAGSYDRVRSMDRDLREFWLPAIHRFGALRAGDRVLDVGCGTGRFAVPLAETCDVVGVDVSREMIRVAGGKGRNAAFLLADAAQIPFREGSFDLALAVMVLHLVPDYPRVVGEIARVAGRALIGTIDMEARTQHAIDEAFPSVDGIDRSRFPRIADIVAATREAGFDLARSERVPWRIESTTEEFLERVRSRYLSTLTLLPPSEFERGLRWLEAELPGRGPTYAYDHAVTFVAASRRSPP